MSHATSQRGRRAAAAAFVTLLLLTSVPAAFARETGLPVGSGEASGLQAAIGAPVDGSTFRRDVTVEFTDASASSSSCPITNWRWSFGDGANSTQQNPTHTYDDLGDFVVALQVRSSSCTDQISTTSITLHVVNLAPTVSASGPSSGSAGDKLSFVATASDEDGEIRSYELLVDGGVVSVSLNATLTHMFTVAGPHEVVVVARDDDDARAESAPLAVDIAAGPLDSIHVLGPDPVTVGSTHTLDAVGLDAYGNSVPLEQETFEHTFQSEAGVETVCVTDSGVTGCQGFDVVADGLYGIVITGPANLTVNTTATYGIVGKDAYGNDVPTSNATMNYTAPTTSGVYAVCYSEGDVEGCANVTVLADAPVRIEIAGPDMVSAGSVTNYTLTGFDTFDNVAVLSQSVVVFTAPTTPGTVQVCYTENVTAENVTACKGVQVFSAALSRIEVDGVDEMPVATTRTFDVSGYDEFDNDVALAVSSFDFTAGTVVGVTPVCYSEGGVQGCKNVTIQPGALASIQVLGPDEQVVNTTATYTPRGFDAYGNPVPLAVASLTHETQTVAGPENVCYTEQNVTGCKLIMAVADAVVTIRVSGVDTMVVNATSTFTLDGFDRYGNAARLETTSLEYTAPMTVGPADVCHTEQNVTGCKTIDVVAGALFEILVEGPDTVIAGSNATFNVSGEDEFGNDVPLDTDHVNFTAPRSVGTAQVCHTEDNVSGCKAVEVVVDALHSILVVGPDAVEAGSSTPYYFSGFDQYGNAVDLDTIATSFQAPTSVGTTEVCHSEDGVTGCKTVQVVPGAPVEIAVTGPAQVVVNATAVFLVDGRDAYGNPGAVSVSSITYTAPSTPGTDEVCYTENGHTGCASVEIVPSPLRAISVSGPSSVATGATATYTLTGLDSQGRLVPLAQTTLLFTAPRVLSEQQVCYTEHGITGCKSVTIVPARIEVSLSATRINLGRPVQATAVAFDDEGALLPATFTWSATRGTIDANGAFLGKLPGNAVVTARIGNATGSANVTLTAQLLVTIDVAPEHAYGEQVSGTVRVTYIDGTPVENATVQVTLTNTLLAAAGQVGRNSQTVTTDADGKAGFVAPSLWALPGSYRVDASASRFGNTGVASAAYSVE